MKNKDAIVLNYLRNKPGITNKNPLELREYFLDCLPTCSVSGVWYHLIIDCLDTVDWFAISNFINNKEKYDYIKEEQRGDFE